MWCTILHWGMYCTIFHWRGVVYDAALEQRAARYCPGGGVVYENAQGELVYYSTLNPKCNSVFFVDVSS